MLHEMRELKRCMHMHAPWTMMSASNHALILTSSRLTNMTPYEYKITASHRGYNTMLYFASHEIRRGVSLRLIYQMK